MAERSNALDCKSSALVATQVRILLCAPESTLTTKKGGRMNTAERITGMTKREIFNYDFPSAKSGKGFFGITHRNIKVFVGLILTPDDLEKEREKLKNNIPKALRR